MNNLERNLSVAIAKTINEFKYTTNPKDFSPPNLTMEEMRIRNLAIIDITNKIAEEVGVYTSLSKEEFLELALSRGDSSGQRTDS